MLTSEFESKLRKLNRDLWIDFNHRSFPEHQDFPASGLYFQSKFIMGVPQREIHRDSVWGVDLEKLEIEGVKGLPSFGSWLDNDWVAYLQNYNATVIDDRIIARGYGFILSELVRMGYINLEQTERIFGVYLVPNKPEATYPRRYLGVKFEGV